MSEPIATDINVQFEVSPEAVLELTPDWIAYLQDNDPPAMIAGIDASVSPTSADVRMA